LTNIAQLVANKHYPDETPPTEEHTTHSLKIPGKQLCHANKAYLAPVNPEKTMPTPSQIKPIAALK